VSEQRKNPRKIFKVKAVLAMDGQPPMPGRTCDIGSDGVSVTVPHPLQTGQTGQVVFDLLIDGKPVPVQARCKATYCLLSSGDFKVGFQFLTLDPNAVSQIARFMR